MGLISRVGKRSWRSRFFFGVLFVLLSIGAASMVYPLLIMVSGSTGSDADAAIPSAYPRFWFDDTVLFRKYAESKYNGSIAFLEARWRIRLDNWEKLDPPPPVDPELLADFLEWRGQSPWWRLGFLRGDKILPSNARLMRNQLYAKYHGDVDLLRRDLKLPYKHWNHLYAPYDPNPNRTRSPDDPFSETVEAFSRTRPVDERMIANLDGEYWRTSLYPKYARIQDYNKAHATAFTNYAEVFLAADVPPVWNPPAGVIASAKLVAQKNLARKDWEDFVRHGPQMKLTYLHLDASLAPAFRKFLEGTYGTIAAYNEKFKTTFAAFADVPFPTQVPEPLFAQVDWDTFIKTRAYCPLEAIHIYGPRQAFEEFVARKRGIARGKVGPLNLPIEQADWHDTLAHASDLRWEFTTRNYKDALGFIALHGNGIINTLIFCALAIVTHLIVNPLAAYALSRYKLPSTYSILLFCMATMAFPGEVTMIPRFLLLKSFPLWSLVAGTVGFALALMALGRLAPRVPELIRIFVALAAGVAVGAWLIPSITTHTHISLLNTFAALVLPGMASGFSIFLLKGFFDSLPPELYEAADIDGASEWMKFWMITMGLSKPILAVIGLGAFTSAYSQFMMALIIIPDQHMWTLMVWLYQFQAIAHQAVNYAALVIAAVPTLLVFVFCQNLIIRGIVVPVEK